MPPSCKGWTHKQLQKLSKLGRIFQGLREGEWVRRRVPLHVAWSYSILHSFFFPLSPSPQSPWGQKNTCICGKHDFNRCSEISSDCIVRCALWFQHYHWYLLPLGLLSSLSNRMNDISSIPGMAGEPKWLWKGWWHTWSLVSGRHILGPMFPSSWLCFLGVGPDFCKPFSFARGLLLCDSVIQQCHGEPFFFLLASYAYQHCPSNIARPQPPPQQRLPSSAQVVLTLSHSTVSPTSLYPFRNTASVTRHLLVWSQNPGCTESGSWPWDLSSGPFVQQVPSPSF